MLMRGVKGDTLALANADGEISRGQSAVERVYIRQRHGISDVEIEGQVQKSPEASHLRSHAYIQPAANILRATYEERLCSIEA